MEIGDVRMRLIDNPEIALRAVASFTIDGCFVVHDVKVFDKNRALSIAMPSRRTSSGEYKDFAHPINAETRAKLEEIILGTYRTMRG